MSRGELKANYSKYSRVPYTFTVSTYQMALLLPFNSADTHTYDELQTITNLNKESLDGSLGVLVKSGVLLIEPKGEIPGASAGQKLTLNLDYKSKKLRVNLNQGIKTEQKQESDGFEPKFPIGPQSLSRFPRKFPFCGVKRWRLVRSSTEWWAKLPCCEELLSTSN